MWHLEGKQKLQRQSPQQQASLIAPKTHQFLGASAESCGVSTGLSSSLFSQQILIFPNYGRMICLWLLTIILILLFSDSAMAASGSSAPNVSFEEIVNQIIVSVQNIHLAIQDVSQKVLLFLVTIGIVFFGVSILLRKGILFTNLNIKFILLIVLFGCFNYLIVNGDDIAKDIINSFIMLSSKQGQSVGFTNTFNDFFQLVEAFYALLINKDSLVFVFGLILIYAIIVVFLVNFAVTYISAIFISSIGIISFALSFTKATKFIAINYIKLVLGYGLKMLTLYIIFFLGLDIFHLIFNSLAMQISSGQILTVQDLGLTIFLLFFILVASIHVPNIITRLVR